MISRKKLLGILYFILFFPFISPLNWASSMVIENIYYICKYMSTAIILLVTVVKVIKRERKCSFPSKTLIILVSVYYLIYIISTKIKAPEYMDSVLKAVIPEIAFVLLATYLMYNDDEIFLNRMSNVFIFYTLINLILAVACPGIFGTRIYDGRYIYLLGERNSLIYFLLPGMTVTILNAVINHKKEKMYAMIILTTLSVLIAGSSTALGTLLIILVLYIVCVHKAKFAGKILNLDVSAKAYAIIYVILWVMIIVMQNATFFSFFIEQVLGRNLTFTNRTLIWTVAWVLIAHSPIWGYGGYFVQHITILGWTTYTGHNFFLQSLIDAGLVSVAVLVFIICLTCFRFDREKKEITIKIIKTGLFGIFVSMLMESYDLHYVNLLLVIGWFYMDKCKYINVRRQ